LLFGTLATGGFSTKNLLEWYSIRVLFVPRFWRTK